MKPESLLGTSLDLILRVAVPSAYPADARVGRFFRERRYLGSRDRRFVSEAAYGWLRRSLAARSRWRAWISRTSPTGTASETGGAPLPDETDVPRLEAELAARELEGPEGSRQGSEGTASGAPDEAREALRRVYLLDLLALAADGSFPWDFARTAAAARGLGEPGEPPPGWTELRERAMSPDFLAEVPLPEDPLELFALEASLPEWLAARLVEMHGLGDARALGRAFLEPATVDLRVNLRRCDRLEVRADLERETGKRVELTPFSPAGLRLSERVNLTATRPSRKSWIEVQDEGSQIAVFAAEPEPGSTVIDACAGSGGKTLAVADLIFPDAPGVPAETPPGRVHALDVSRRRLAELERRARDAGLAGRIRMFAVYPAGDLPEELQAGEAGGIGDLVIVDAPCTGFGTLRRNPELKRRWGPNDATRFGELQLGILERFQALVKPGGRLIYIVCSFLREESGDVAAAFERAHPEFEPHASRWAGAKLPPGCLDGHRIRLDPLLTGTDAFFICAWKRGG